MPSPSDRPKLSALLGLYYDMMNRKSYHVLLEPPETRFSQHMPTGSPIHNLVLRNEFCNRTLRRDHDCCRAIRSIERGASLVSRAMCRKSERPATENRS